MPPSLLAERQTRSLHEVYPERSRRGRDDIYQINVISRSECDEKSRLLFNWEYPMDDGSSQSWTL